MAAILEEGEMTQEQYDAFILLISFDGEARSAFEAIVAWLREGGGGEAR